MTLATYPLNGVTGTTVTTANTGGYQLFGGTGSTATLLAAAAYQGSTGIRFVSSGANASCETFRFAGNATATQAAFSIRFRIPASTPSSNFYFFEVTDTGLSVPGTLRLQYTTAGLVQLVDNASTLTTLMTAAQATANSWFRIEVVVTNISATAGAATVRAYSTGSTQVGSTISTTTGNFGTLAMAGVIVGDLVSQAATVDIDSVQLNNGATSEIGEYVPSSTPPTVVMGANQTIANTGTSVNVTCTATPAAGNNVNSYAWSVVSAISSTGATITPPTITNATSQTATFTPVTKGRYILGVIVGDDAGNFSAQQTTRVFVPDALITPIEVTSNSGWATTTPSNVNDTNDATYAESGAVGSASVLVYRLAPLIVATTGFSLIVRSLVQTVGGTQQVELLEGGTVRKNWGAIAPATTVGDIPLTLTSGEMATVGSWNELDVRLTQV